jgi:hypothetical protein
MNANKSAALSPVFHYVISIKLDSGIHMVVAGCSIELGVVILEFQLICGICLLVCLFVLIGVSNLLFVLFPST